MADDGFWPEEAPQDESPEDVASEDAESHDSVALAVAARHALHDEELVVALATGSLEDGGEIERATSLIERCTACRDLHRDVAAIGDALRVEARGTMAAPRDFRLSVDDAQRLGGRVVVRGFLATFRRSITAFAAPIGASIAAIGIVGVLVGSAALSGGAASAPVSAGTDHGATSAPAEVEASGGQPGPKSSERGGAYGPASSPFGTPSGDPAPQDSAATGPNPAAWLIAGSVGLLVAGVLLLFVTFGRGRS